MTRAFTADRRTLTSLRLTAQGIIEPRSGSVPQTVRHMLAMQAQDFPGAKWSVGLRTPGATDATVEASLASGEIVRSWPMRGTLHFTSPEDLGWMLDLTAQRMVQVAAGRHRQLELSPHDFDRARDLAIESLGGGRVLSRTALLAAFDAAGLSTAGQRGAHLIVYLAQTGTIVFGPVDGKTQTFALLDEWVTGPRRLEGDAALGEFAVRYFASHGPATVRDFAWWSSLTLTQARVALAVARGGLEELVIDDVPYFHAPGLERAPSGLATLPGFDEYLLGYQDRSAPLHPDHSELIVPGKNGLFLPTIVVDGEVVGTWKRSVTAKEAIVEAQPFAPLGASQRKAFAASSARYAGFMERELRVID
jgi:hypothetical protein